MIEVRNLIKKYGELTAVSDLNFSIQNGRIYGLLGPNGAGKTTTMNIITGCLAATSGEVKIDGYDIYEDGEKAKKLMGYLPEEPPLYQDMTPREYLDFVAKAKGVEKSRRQDQLKDIMEITQIHPVADRLIKNLSKGYRQRVGIAQALVAQPEIIILDEPTVGLDPKQIIEIRDLIKSLGKSHTVILSSHILSEVRAVCDEIIIISQGKIVASDTPENLEGLFSGSAAVNLKVKATEEEAKAAFNAIEGINNITYKSVSQGILEVDISADKNDGLCENIFFAFADIRRPIIAMHTAQISLEDIFIELTGGKDNDSQSNETVSTGQAKEDPVSHEVQAFPEAPPEDNAAASDDKEVEA